ncbi:heme acquisition protein HasA [Pseudomonas aeruginosa]
MSISISYSTTYSGWTVADYLADWSAYFGDVNHRPGQVVDGSNTGGFNPGPFDGSQYALKSTASDAAFIAGGDLHYTPVQQPQPHPPCAGQHRPRRHPDRRRLQRWLRPGQPGEVSFSNLGLDSPIAQGRDGTGAQGGLRPDERRQQRPQGQIDALLKAVDPEPRRSTPPSTSWPRPASPMPPPARQRRKSAWSACRNCRNDLALAA